MRHVDDITRSIVAQLAEPIFEQCLRRGRDGDLCRPQIFAVDELGPRAVRRDHERTRMRHAHRHRTEAERQRYIKFFDDIMQFRDEAFPLEIGFRSCQEQIRPVVEVVFEHNIERRFVVVLVVVAPKGDERPTGTIVIEGICVEAVEHFALTRTQLGRGDTRCSTGAEKSVKGMNQHRTLGKPAGTVITASIATASLKPLHSQCLRSRRYSRAGRHSRSMLLRCPRRSRRGSDRVVRGSLRAWHGDRTVGRRHAHGWAC